MNLYFEIMLQDLCEQLNPYIYSFAIYFSLYLVEDDINMYSYHHFCFLHFNLVFIPY